MRPGFHVSLYLAGRRVVLIGSGASADERAKRLAAARAEVIRVAPASYRPDVLAGAFLAMAHTDDPELDRRIASDARAARILAYAHDQPDISDFAMPALARRGPLTVAIATSALAPSLARRLRKELQAMLDRAGGAIDDLITHMANERSRDRPAQERRRRLSAIARRLRLEGDLVVDPTPASSEPVEP